MAFGNGNKGGGGFGPKSGSSGSNFSKKIGGSAPNTEKQKFGWSSNPSSFGGGFGGSKSGNSFGSGTNNNSSNAEEQRKSSSDMPVLSKTDIRPEEKQSQIKRTKIVTFSNVQWKKFDNIRNHPSGAQYNEPRVHVLANKENIEFHGYNVSEMDEGVYYIIGKNDDFEIECDVDTSQIKPHPGGFFYISFGIISAMINETGGSLLLNGKNVAQVGSKFNMKLSLSESGKYEVFVNGRKQGEEHKTTTSEIKITIGFKHDAHNCEVLSHAYVKRIKMKQCKGFGSGGFGAF